MILITAVHGTNSQLYFWGTDDLSEGYADEFITGIFDIVLFSPGAQPWPLFFSTDCSNVVTYPNVNSLTDAQDLFPELFL